MTRPFLLAQFRQADRVPAALDALAVPKNRVQVVTADDALAAAAQAAGVRRVSRVAPPFHLLQQNEAILRTLFWSVGGAVATNWALELLVSLLFGHLLAPATQPWQQIVVYVLSTGLPALAVGVLIGLLLGARRGLSRNDAARLQARLQEDFTLVTVSGPGGPQLEAARQALIQAGAGFVAPMRGSLEVRRGPPEPSTEELIARRDLRSAPLWEDDDPAA